MKKQTSPPEKKCTFSYIMMTLTCLLLTSCASMYIPPGANIPLLEEKYETQLEAGVTTNSLYFMGSFAVADKWAIMANGNLSFFNFSNRFDIFDEIKNGFYYSTDDYNFSHMYGELGFGRIKMVDAPQLKLELFGGGGYGAASSYNDNYSKKSSIGENRYFLIFAQSNIGSKWKLKKNNFIEIGGALRLAYSHFNYDHDSIDFQLTEKNFKYNNIHIEPTGFFRIGSNLVRFILKFGFSVRCTFENYGEYNNYYGINIGKPVSTHTHVSVGINFRIGGAKSVSSDIQHSY